MRVSDELLQEMFRRAAQLRAKRQRQKKALLGVGCAVFSIQLVFLLSNRMGMTVANNTGLYGSLVFEGGGNEYVMIALAFFLLGIPAGLGIDALVKRWKQRRIDCYARKWGAERNNAHKLRSES